MRTVIMMAAWMAMGFVVNAEERQSPNERAASVEMVRGIELEGPLEGRDGQGHCSFTARGSVSAPGINLDFACTATEETCKEAIQKAMECAKLTVSMMKRQFRH